MTENINNHPAAKMKLNRALFLIAVIAAAVLFFWTYPRYFCGSSLSLKLSKTALIAKADSLLAEMGYPEPGGTAKISAVCDEELSDQLCLFVELARNIQRSLLPKELSSIKSFTFESIFIPSEQVGGDTYDFIHLEDGKFAAYVLDVSGHGMAAALLASHIQAQIRVMLRYNHEPGMILAEIDEYLQQETPRSMFATIFLLIGDDRGHFVYASAGHNDAFLLRDHGEIKKFKRTGLALGLATKSLYEKVEGKLNLNDCLFIYTDGITEAMNNQKEEYGEQRLISFIKKTAGKENFSDKLRGELYNFTGRGNSDDITGVLIRNEG